jgi:hypothetical protein
VRIAALASSAFLLCSCALLSGRVEVLSRESSYHARVLAIAPASGVKRADAAALARALARRLGSDKIEAVALDESDSVLAGGALTMDMAADPSVRSEVARATKADGIVFLAVEADWRALDVSVIGAATGDIVLHAVARPRGKAFSSPAAAAAGAANALAPLAFRHPERGDLPVP